MRIHYNIFDTLLEPVFVLGADQKVIYCNETAALICGLTIRKITRGMKFCELFEFSEPIEGLKDLIRVCDPTPYKEVTFKTAQGGEGKVQITLQPVFDQMGDKAWIVFVRDVTLEERLQKKYRAELEQKEDVIKALEEAKLQLENYSKNLEVMVAERTRELSELNQTMKALLDSLGQGFFIFDKDGVVLDVTSKACENTVESRPQGQRVWDVLKLSEKQVEGFKKWMTTLFMEMLPFADLAPLGPTSYPHSQGKSISLEYFPLRSSEGVMTGVVVVASDITSLVEAQKQAAQDRASAKLIINLIQSKREIMRFVREAQNMLVDLDTELKKPAKKANVEAIFRSLHTLKGGSALFSIAEMTEECHVAESLLSQYRESKNEEVFSNLKKKYSEVHRSFVKFLDKTREVLGSHSISDERHIEIPVSRIQQMMEKAKGSDGAVVLAELMMEPIGTFFHTYGETALRLAEKQEKLLLPVQYKNDHIPVFPEVYTQLFASFVHAFRNAVDHGLENPQERQKNGKKPEGSLQMDFSVEGPLLKISLKDDGAGVDIAKVRAKLKAKGLDISRKSDQEILQHLFDSQFSTRDVVTETSGRGIGMDAIKIAAEQLGGRAWIESEERKGSTLFVEVPYLTHLPSSEKYNVAA